MNIILSKDDAKELLAVVDLYKLICEDDIASGSKDEDTLYEIETCKRLSKIIRKAIRSSTE